MSRSIYCRLSRLVSVLVGIAGCVTTASPLLAQIPAGGQVEGAAGGEAADREVPDVASDAVASDPTEPQSVELATSDGVLLAGTFYPAEAAGKSTPIVVMLADEGESPVLFDRLAFRLQMPGSQEKRKPIAVLSVALRGQGDSTRVRLPDGTVVDRRGMKPTRADAAAMVKTDMEAVRRFLVDKNDDGQINLNRLGYLGVGLGAMVAANAAAVDWAIPILDRGKQGRDVKALAMVSPPWKALGLTMLPALRQPGVQTQVAVYLTYGKQERTAEKTAERIVMQLENGRKRQRETDNPPAPVIDRPGESKLQGAKWLKQAGTEGEDQILEFFDQHLSQPDLPWIQRRLD